MRFTHALFLALFATGCYQARRIVLPETRTSVECLMECQLRYERCTIGPFCQKRKDDCILACPGARLAAHAHEGQTFVAGAVADDMLFR